MAGDRIGGERSTAFVGDVRHHHFELVCNLGHSELCKAARADCAIGYGAGIFPGSGDHILEAPVRCGGMSGDHHRRFTDEHDRRQIMQGIERQVRQQARIDAVGIEHQQECGAVGFRHGRRLRANRSRCAAAVLDHDRRLEIRLEQRLNPPCDLVGGPARRKRHDDADRSRRPALRADRCAKPQESLQCDDERGKAAQQLGHDRSSVCNKHLRGHQPHSAARRRSISMAPALIRGISSRPNSIASFRGSKPRMRKESTPSI